MTQTLHVYQNKAQNHETYNKPLLNPDDDHTLTNWRRILWSAKIKNDFDKL